MGYRVISTLDGVTLIKTLLITDLVSPPGLQVGFTGASSHSSPLKTRPLGLRADGLDLRGRIQKAFQQTRVRIVPIPKRPRVDDINPASPTIRNIP